MGDRMADNAIEVLVDDHGILHQLFDRVSQPDEDRPAVLKQLVLGLSAHVAMEKELLVPVLKERADDGTALAAHLTAYHDEVERVLVLLDRRKVNSPDVPDLVTSLLDLTVAHIVDADAVVIPALRAAMGSEELAELGGEMVSDERRLLTHPHPHLPDSGPIAKVTRWAASVVDRKRDDATDIGRAST